MQNPWCRVIIAISPVLFLAMTAHPLIRVSHRGGQRTSHRKRVSLDICSIHYFIYFLPPVLVSSSSSWVVTKLKIAARDWDFGPSKRPYTPSVCHIIIRMLTIIWNTQKYSHSSWICRRQEESNKAKRPCSLPRMRVRYWYVVPARPWTRRLIEDLASFCLLYLDLEQESSRFSTLFSSSVPYLLSR